MKVSDLIDMIDDIQDDAGTFLNYEVKLRVAVDKDSFLKVCSPEIKTVILDTDDVEIGITNDTVIITNMNIYKMMN